MTKLDYIPNTDIKMIHVDKSYTFGVDSIILLDFAKMKKGKTLIDIGSGSGILSLGANAYYNLKEVYAVEIQDEKSELLEKNLKLNDISNIEIINKDLNQVDLETNTADYIITNPPYYKISDNINNKSEEFLISRQEKYLTLQNIFDFANKTLKDRGKMYMIHKPERMVDIFKSSGNLKTKRIRFVQSTYNKKPQFILIEFVKNANDGLKIEDPLIIYKDGTYSEEMKKINGHL
ncbi:methyltransferase [Anaerococcus sp. mt242]|uniref:tRNA1(Val) (adenine(37)-N6)-methyltransferase n=1 Tax=Anaerococcus sp. mt242 TaxID=2661917 RepID=UPI001933BCF6|nr:methyltransferase [Anaerococcus sp. mt242]MBM0046452.1 methyltransferase [Anaerococcus sp. mt242]